MIKKSLADKDINELYIGNNIFEKYISPLHLLPT